MAAEAKQNNSRFWIPILIMAIISVVSVTSNIFLLVGRGVLIDNHEKTMRLIEKNVEWNIKQDTRILTMEERYLRIDDKLGDVLDILKNHAFEFK